MPRPHSVTLLALSVLFMGAVNALGFVSGVRHYTVLARLPLSLPPAVPLVSAAVWAAVFALLGWGLWRLRRWALWGTLAGVTVYVAQAWLERILFGRSDYLSTSAWFYIGWDAVLLLFVWGILLQPGVRQSFSE